MTHLDFPTLADPGTGTARRAGCLELESPAIWPGRQTLLFAPTSQRLSYFDQTAVIEAQQMQAMLHLAPGLALELEELALTSSNWQINDRSGPLLGAASLRMAMQQTVKAETYRIELSADDFASAPKLTALMSQTSGLPRTFEALKGEMDVTFDHVWDRAAIELRRPQPRHIALTRANAHWGDLKIKATGVLSVDEHGLPTGVVFLQVENWRDMLEGVERSGALPYQDRVGVERLLALFAGLGGNPEDLETQLNFRDGMVALGPIPLGPAPRLVLR